MILGMNRRPVNRVFTKKEKALRRLQKTFKIGD